MGIVTWEVNKEEEMYQETVGSEVEEKARMEVSKNGMLMFANGSDDEGTRILSGMGDDEKMNEGNCRGVFEYWISTTEDGSMGC